MAKAQIMMMMGLAAVTVAAMLVPVVQADEGQTSNVQVLDSENFEHNTQASTGMTTGDWFIKFYAPWCGHCKRLAPEWDTLADDLNQQVNIAKVDCTVNMALCARFDVKGYPTLIYLKLGKMKPYNGKRTLKDLTEFAVNRGESDKEWEEIPEYNPMREKMEEAMAESLADMRSKYPKVIKFVEDFVASDMISGDPIINSVFLGLALGGGILVMLFLVFCILDTCFGTKPSRGRAPIAKSKKNDSDDSDSDEKKSNMDSPARGTARRRNKATTD